MFLAGRTHFGQREHRWLKLWNLTTRREVAIFELPEKTIPLAFTPDESDFAAETANLIHVWHAPTLVEIAAEKTPVVAP